MRTLCTIQLGRSSTRPASRIRLREDSAKGIDIEIRTPAGGGNFQQENIYVGTAGLTELCRKLNAAHTKHMEGMRR